jgi:WD40 repeat protein
MAEGEHAVTREEFVRGLDTLRQRAGLTIRQVAKAVGAPHGTIGGYFSGRHFPSAGQTDLFVRILETCGVTEPEEIERWVDTLVRVRRPVGRRVTPATAPYRGLACFETDHGDWFFGREALTGELVDRLAGDGMLTVVGPSGSGKSSLLRAGLCTALRGTRCVVFTPGARPLEAMARHLAEATGRDQDGLEHDLRVRPATVGDTGLVLVVDQLEEIFTLCVDDTERERFVAALAAVPARVVVGMRADFYAPAIRHPELASALQRTQVVVPPMSEPELRRAIAEPARKANLDLEDGLVELLLHEVGAAAHRDTGALPLLSHALLATWERGSRGRMTVEDYRATGGISGAVAQTAETVYAELTPAQRDTARQLFLRLVHVGEDTADTRRRVHHAELAADEVLDRYVERRLLTVDADTVNISHEALIMAWPRLREWIDADRAGLRVHRQLTEAAQAWRDGGRDADALYRGNRLAVATQWVEEHRADLNALEREFLDAGVQRHRAEQAQARRRTRRLHQLVAAFAALTLLAGTMAVVALQQRSRANGERDLAVSRQVAITANQLRDYDPGLAAQLALSAYRIAPTIEARSSLIASSGAPTVTRIVRPGGARQVVAVTRDGRLLAGAGAAEAVGSDTDVLLWDLTGPRSPRRVGTLRGHTEPVYAAVFGPDGRILATGGADGTVRLWDVSDPAHATPLSTPLTGSGDRILGLAFSPDGGVLAAGGGNNTVRLWDVSEPRSPAQLGGTLTGAEGDVQAVAFRPDGRLLAAADAGGAVLLWDVGDPGRPRPVGAPISVPGIVNTVAFTPDGTALAAGSNDRTIRFWTVSDAAPPVPIGEPLTAADGRVYGIAFDSTGDTVAAASADSAVRLWDWRDRRLVAELPHREPVTSAVFRYDDRRLVTNSVDGVARVWAVPGPSIPAADRTVYTVAFGPDGDLLASAGVDVRLAGLPDRDHPRQTGPPMVPSTATDRIGGTVAISPDGRTLAADNRADHSVLLWDIADPAAPVPLGPPLTGPTESVEDLEFSRDGRFLASASDDGMARLWDVTDPRAPVAVAELRPAGESDYVFQVRFSPDSRTLVATTSVGTVAFWDLTDPRRPGRLGAPLALAQDIIYAAAFDPDGRVLAVGSSNGVVSLWDVDDPTRPRGITAVTELDGHIQTLAFSSDGRYLAGGARGRIQIWRVVDGGLDPFAGLDRARESTWSVEFAPEGHTLAAASGDVKLWDVDPEGIATRICATAGEPLTEAEWRKHVPGAAYRPACNSIG